MSKEKQYQAIMYQKLLEHRGHKVEIVSYGDPDSPENVAIECEDCHSVLVDYNIPLK
jgi:hypothetical protein